MKNLSLSSCQDEINASNNKHLPDMLFDIWKTIAAVYVSLVVVEESLNSFRLIFGYCLCCICNCIGGPYIKKSLTCSSNSYDFSHIHFDFSS